MDRGQDLITLLSRVVATPADLPAAVKRFQSQVFESAGGDLGTPDVEEILRTLAYDLDFYEPDPKAAAEDASYYGNDRALNEIRRALALLRTAGAA